MTRRLAGHIRLASSRGFTPREFTGVQFHEVVHARRRLAGELEQVIRHAVIPPLRVKFGHHREVVEEVRWHPKLTKRISPPGERHVTIADGSAECLGKDARIVVQISRLKSGQIVNMTNVRGRGVEDRGNGTRHINSRDRRGLAVTQRQRQFVAVPDASSGETQEEAFEEDRRPHRDDRQPRPRQCLFRKPVQLMLRAGGGLGDAHLRHRHLRHVHESLDTVVARHCGGVDRGFQISRRDRHSEIDARATFDRTVHRGKVGQIALHDLGPELAQALSAFILPPDQGAHLMPFGEQHCGEVAADGTEIAGRSGHEDRTAMCGFHRHIIYLLIAFRWIGMRLEFRGHWRREQRLNPRCPARQCLLDKRRSYGSSTALSSPVAARMASAFGCAVRS
ncbi:hypothetical protein NIES4073_23260 [Kalymmatonema gypsitolerans NIES-4073]|nr:hypothetical protein NIES4073_23260 [Scytonema sp. NIES-4073]